jgi:hypothetical protein
MNFGEEDNLRARNVMLLIFNRVTEASAEI